MQPGENTAGRTRKHAATAGKLGTTQPPRADGTIPPPASDGIGILFTSAATISADAAADKVVPANRQRLALLAADQLTGGKKGRAGDRERGCRVLQGCLQRRGHRGRVGAAVRTAAACRKFLGAFLAGG